MKKVFILAMAFLFNIVYADLVVPDAPTTKHDFIAFVLYVILCCCIGIGILFLSRKLCEKESLLDDKIKEKE